MLATLATLLAIVRTTGVSAQTTRPIFWGTDGEILRVARLGNTVFAVGRFDYIGPNTGGGVPVDPTSGAPIRPFPRVTGTVSAVVPDGAGGWFIGGDFSGVEGRACSNLAHVLADGTLAEWFPRIDPSTSPEGTGAELRVGTVAALALRGNTLYVGGRFTVAGTSRRHLVAIDTRTGILEPFAPDADGPVTALLLQGNRLFAGGGFAHIGGQSRSRLASLDARTGAADDWNPSADGAVRALAMRGRSLFVGGEFDHAGGAARNSIAEIDVATGRATSWDARLLPQRFYIAHGDWSWPYVAALVVRGQQVYAGGFFTSAHAVNRTCLVALDAETAIPTGFDARVNGAVHALALDGSRLDVGGSLSDVGGSYRPNVAAVDPTTGACLEWNPRAYGEVDALAAGKDAIYTGGSFFTIHDWYAQKNAAAFDATTGAPLAWAPDFSGSWASSLVASEDEHTLYAAGPFMFIDGQQRAHLAAFDAATGALLPWNPWIRSLPIEGSGGGSWSPIAAMVRIGNTLYFGGDFDHVDGAERIGLAAVDGTTGALLDWDPGLRRWDHAATALGALGNDVFVAGMFDSAGLAPRRDFAQIDGSTGLAKPFDIEPGFYMWAREHGFGRARMILPTEERVYVSGSFTDLAGHDAFHFAAFDPTGGFTSFDARLNESEREYDPPVAADGVRIGNALYVAGRFTRIGGQPRNNVAALDPLTGAALDWNPDAGYAESFIPIYAANDVDFSHGTLYVAGGFRRFGGYPCAGLAAATLESPSPRPRALALSQAHEPTGRLALRASSVRPGGELTLELSLPAPVPARLEIFDLQGRRVAEPLLGDVRPAGMQSLTLDSRAWKSGLYYARLSAGVESVTRKFVVLR